MLTERTVFALVSLVNLMVAFILNGLETKNNWILAAKILNIFIAILIIIIAFI